MFSRLCDFIFSLTALVLLSPFLIPLVIILKFTGEGEIFYKQERIGKNGVPFGLIKFATMVKNSPNMGSGDITLKNDPRVLPLGNFLRKSKINELPQLVNILKGDMSVVGPRPHTKRNFQLYTKQAQEIVAREVPGLTGIGSIIFRDEEGILESASNKIVFYETVIAPYKGELECWYAMNKSLLKYFQIILMTAWSVVSPQTKLVWSVFKDLPKPPIELSILMEK